MGRNITNLKEQCKTLQNACDAVSDTHGAGHIILNPYIALYGAKVHAEFHANHNGDWPIGSCDAELFALEWEIYLAENQPKPKSLWNGIKERIIGK